MYKEPVICCAVNKTEDDSCVLFSHVNALRYMCKMCHKVSFLALILLSLWCPVHCGWSFNTDCFTFAYLAQVGRKINSQERLNDLSRAGWEKAGIATWGLALLHEGWHCYMRAGIATRGLPQAFPVPTRTITEGHDNWPKQDGTAWWLTVLGLVPTIIVISSHFWLI